MEIRNKTYHDPAADLPVIEAYMAWALEAAEQVVGRQGLGIILRDNGLERFIEQYPSENLSLSNNITYADYTNLCAGLLKFYGRAGKSVVIRIGRIASRLAIEHQGAIFNVAARTAVKLLPLSAQIKTGLENMQEGFRKIYKDTDLHMRVEDRGDTWAYIAELCPVCAGKQSDAHICWSWIGILQEGTLWLTGRELRIEEVECRAKGALACVWEVSKTERRSS